MAEFSTPGDWEKPQSWTREPGHTASVQNAFRSKLLVVAASMPPAMNVPSCARLARTLHFALFQLWAVKVDVQDGVDGEEVGPWNTKRASSDAKVCASQWV